MRLGCFFVLFTLSLTAAKAGAWLPHAGNGKIILTHYDETAMNRNFVNLIARQSGDTQTDYHKLSLEYGLSHKLTLLAHLDQNKRHQANYTYSDRHLKIGLMTDAPFLKTGLLPPYAFKALQKLLPRVKTRREKKASLAWSATLRHTNFGNGRDTNRGRVADLALADKVHFGRFSVSQTLETANTRAQGVDWAQSLYRFEIGWAERWHIGSEAHFFDDKRHHYAALSHFVTASHCWPERAVRLKLLSGQKRETGFARADVMAVEIEFGF